VRLGANTLSNVRMPERDILVVYWPQIAPDSQDVLLRIISEEYFGLLIV
jgi:hypothetical protein